MALFGDLAKDMSDAHLDALEDALGTKIKDREGFLEAFKGLVGCCSSEPEEDEEDPEESGDEPTHKKGPSIAIVLGGKPPKGDLK